MKFKKFTFGIPDQDERGVGLIALFESERKAPGKSFFYYVPYENELTYHVSIAGDFFKEKDGFMLKSDEKETHVVIGDFGLPEADKNLMIYNFLMNIG